MEIILELMIVLLVMIILIRLWKIIILPKIIEKTTIIIEKNPKWITPKLRLNYYGFSNIDIIIVKSFIGTLPRLNIVKKNKKAEPRLEILISEDTPVNDIDKIAQLALRGKLYIFHGVATPNKSADWLSFLLYILDGGNINDIIYKSWKDRNDMKDKRPVDGSN